MDKELIISIVTVCYNTVNTIENTIRSVINQTYSNIDYIVIDGASQDGTIEIIRKYKNKIACIISEPDKGIYNAMNKGIKYAKGDYVLFLNAGDVLYTINTISNMVDSVTSDVDVLYGKSLLRTVSGNKVIPPDDIRKIKKGPVFRHNAALFRLSLQRLYKFDESMAFKFGYGLDYNSILEMYNSGAIFKEVDQIIIQWENNGVSSDYKKNLMYTYRISHKNKFVLTDWILYQLKLLKYYILKN